MARICRMIVPSRSPPKNSVQVRIAIKVLTDLLCLFRLRSIDIKVFQTFAPCEKNARAAQQPLAAKNSLLQVR